MSLPTTAAANCWTGAEVRLATQLSNCAEFQTLTGAVDSAAALASIWIDALPAPTDKEEFSKTELNSLFPYALIYTPENSFGTKWIAHPQNFQFGGVIGLDIARRPASGASISETERLWKNIVGVIIEQMAARTTQESELGWSELQVVELGRTHEDDVHTFGDIQIVKMLVTWGN